MCIDVSENSPKAFKDLFFSSFSYFLFIEILLGMNGLNFVSGALHLNS